MSIFDSIEKLITEHGSAAILTQQLSFAKDQFSDLERKVSDLQTQVGRLDAQLERERLDHELARKELQQFKDEHAEEVCIYSAIEFRRGKRTRGTWMPFCPRCHMPSRVSEHFGIVCSANCGWVSDLPSHDLPRIISQL